MNSITARKQEFLRTGFQLKFIPDDLFPMELIEYSIIQSYTTSNLKTLNFLSIEIIFKTLELLVKKQYHEQITQKQIQCALKVIELGSSVEELEVVYFRYIVIGDKLKKNNRIHKNELIDILNITGGKFQKKHIQISNKNDLFIEVLPVNFPVNLIFQKNKLEKNESNFFSDELIDYVLLCPIVFCPLSELQYANP